MTWSYPFVRLSVEYHKATTCLADLDLEVVDGRTVHLFLVGRRALDNALHEHDRLSRKTLSPADHDLGDTTLLFCENTLDGQELIAKDEKDDLCPWVQIMSV